MSSATVEKSVFDNLGQDAMVPNEMQPRITVRDINTAEPGPYYVYIPGIDAEGLQPMLHSPAYSRIPAGEVFRIGAIEESVLAGRLDQAVPHKEVVISHPIEQKEIGRLHVIAIPAGTTLQALRSDRAITSHILAHIEPFDKIDVEYSTLNEMIRPSRVKELDKPADMRNEIEAVGMLAIRLRWLQDAVERLETGRMLESHRRVIDARPFLRDAWHRAIMDYMIPANDQFRIIAETRIAAIEDRMRNPNNTDNYDRYYFKLAWLLGRKPERTALSRTLESTTRGGLSPEEIKMYIETVVAKNAGNGQPAATASTIQKMQCPDCAEEINTINGGPPRKCRHCGYEFRPVGESAAPYAPTAFVEPSPGVQAAIEMDKAMPLATESNQEDDDESVGPMAPPVKLSPEDEADIEKIAARLDPKGAKDQVLKSILGG